MQLLGLLSPEHTLGGKKGLPALSVSLMSPEKQCFIYHLEHNEIKEMRGCHKRTFFLPEIIPPTSNIAGADDINRAICM